MMIIKDSNRNKTEAALQKGDRILLRTEERTISFFRDGQDMLFSDGSDKMLFPWGEAAFKELIILLSETHCIEHSLTKETVLPAVKINELDTGNSISFRF